MAFRVNYNQQRGDRNRIKEQKKRERLARREEDAQQRKAERTGRLPSERTENAVTSSAPKDTD
jgi:hypothetical protein